MADDYSPSVLIGSNTGPARFGSSVVIGGDLDQNGFDDLIIGAPYEELTPESSGAIYIYYVTANGLSEDRKQVNVLNSNVLTSFVKFKFRETSNTWCISY